MTQEKPLKLRRKVMTRITSTAANRALSSAFIALALTTTLSQISNAASPDTGIWNVDPAKSKFNATSATLALRRAESAKSVAGSLIVISGQGVYLVTGAMASNSKALKPVDFSRMTQTGDAVLIGKQAHSVDPCSFACVSGRPESTRTLTFKVVPNSDQRIKDMLAYAAQNK
jgi:hypothetical protein